MESAATSKAPQTFELYPFNNDDLIDVRDIVQVKEVESGLVCESGGWKVFSEYVDHGNSLGLSREDWPCLGYRVEAAGKIVAISGDAVDCTGLDRLARDADILVQCCYLAEAELTTSAFRRLTRHVIACSDQVGKIAARNQVKKLVLTHIRPKSEDMMRSLLADVRQDYDGELCLGEDLMAIDV